MNKNLTLIYYSFEPESAKALAESLRKNKQSAQLRDAAVFNESEECDQVIIQEDVSEFYRDRLREAYGDKVQVPDGLRKSIAELDRGEGVEFDPTLPEKKKRGRKPKVAI